VDLGAGDGRFALARASGHPDELVLAVDASRAGMREASWRAARSARRGGLPNAVFVVSSFEALPPQLSGLAALVAVHFPWGSLLRAALGEDAEGAARIASLVAPGGLLRLLLSASARDAAHGAVHIEPRAIVAAYVAVGMVPVTCRVATPADIAGARSSWGRRLLAHGRQRSTWLLELQKSCASRACGCPMKRQNCPQTGAFSDELPDGSTNVGAD
jgi:hypothetical protein